MNTQVQTKALTIVDSVKQLEPQFKAALPAHMPSERFTRIALSAINGNPDLLDEKIDKRSLFASCMRAAQDGLVLDNREAALVTFNNKGTKQVQYIPMVAGILKKMRNTGDISTVSYGLVYQKEWESGQFKYIKGDKEILEHTPILFAEKGDLIGVYAVVTLKDGQKIREFMDMDQIKKVRAVSRAGNSEYGPWTKWFEEMCVKSVLRKVSKLCPMSSDLDRVFRDEDGDQDDEVKTPMAVEPTPAEEKPAPKKKSTLDKMKATLSKDEDPVPDVDYIDGEASSEGDDIPL